MNKRNLQKIIGLTVIAAAIQVATAAPPDLNYEWFPVVNNGDATPCATPPCRKFNSYNQPSVNANSLVVFRARSKGGSGGEPEHGVYTRDTASVGSSIVKILDRGNTPVPQPNNQVSTFTEPPSFPRIDIHSNTIATRGNHQPVWKVDEDKPLGTTGIYTNPFGSLITGAAKLGPVLEFSFFEVPEAPGTPFDVFPGAPAVTDANTIVFKGNYTVGLDSKTGVYYRDLVSASILDGDGNLLTPGGGDNPVVLIANNTSTLIPGTTTVFGSTSPPSAAGRHAVFAGFDNEENPTKGGIYMAPLSPYDPINEQPMLTTLLSIGSPVPGESSARFNKLGEGVSFDGRLVSFWGAWGEEFNVVRLYCPKEGNQNRRNYCNRKLEVPDPDNLGQTKIIGDPNSICNDDSDPEYGTRCYQEKNVPLHQGIFVFDTRNFRAYKAAGTNDDFNDFVYWTYAGRTPGVGEGDEENDDDGEPIRWRSSAFMAVSGHGANFFNAFKARTGVVDPITHAYVNPVDGIYLVRGPGQLRIGTVIKTGMPGTLLDPKAIDGLGTSLPITAVGIERDGFRNGHLVINASMANDDASWAGIYLGEMYVAADIE